MNRTADVKNVKLPCSDHHESFLTNSVALKESVTEGAKSCKTGDRRSDSGIALLIVLVMLAIIGALTADFAYNTQIELEAAVNMRDQLQAEYLAKSSQQFGQSLIAMQAQQAGQLGQLGKSLGIPLDNVSIIDFAKPLLQIVFGSDTNLLPKRFNFELEIVPEDGKIGLSCSGGLSPDAKQQQTLYQIISSFFRFPTRTQNFYSFLGKTSSEGLQLTPENLATWLIDWMDVDLSRYNPSGPSSGTEEKYDQNMTRYEMHNHYLDTPEELRLIHGMEHPKVFGLLSPFLTPYSQRDCRLSLAAVPSSSWPLVAAILVASSDPSSSTDPNLLQVAKQLTPLLKTLWPLLKDKSMKEIAQTLAPEIPAPIPPSGQTSFCPQLAFCQTTSSSPATGSGSPQPATPPPISKVTTNLSELLCSPLIAKLPDANQKTNFLLQGGPPPKTPPSPLRPLRLCPNLLEQFIKVPETGTSRRFYRIKTQGIVERGNQKITKVHINAVWDSQNINSHVLCSSTKCNTGAWVYFRLE